MKVIVINGPNLNMLGSRDASHYGGMSLKSIESFIAEEFKDVQFTFFQSNIEGELVNCIQQAREIFNGIIINPGAYGHTSVAIRDALADCPLPKIEVHLSHLVNREEFRQNLLTAGACNGYLSGFKQYGYSAAVYLLKKILLEQNKND